MKEKICSILLVDWPNRDIPLRLVQSGFIVFSYSPDGYNQVLVESKLPADTHGIIEPAVSAGVSKDGLVFLRMQKPPVAVDLVMIYRPPEEHASIIRDQVLPLGAKIFGFSRLWNR